MWEKKFEVTSYLYCHRKTILGFIWRQINNWNWLGRFNQRTWRLHGSSMHVVEGKLVKSLNYTNWNERVLSFKDKDGCAVNVATDDKQADQTVGSAFVKVPWKITDFVYWRQRICFLQLKCCYSICHGDSTNWLQMFWWNYSVLFFQKCQVSLESVMGKR